MPIDINTAFHYPRAHTSIRLNAFISKSVAVLALISATFFTTAIAHAEPSQSWTLNRALVPFLAEYTVGNDTLTAGDAVIELSRTDTGNDWRYSLQTEPRGLFKIAGRGYVQETSTFEIVERPEGNIIQPAFYQFRQDNQSKRSIDATFNWGQNLLYFHHGGTQETATVNDGTLDRMSMTLAMMSNLTADFKDIIIDVFDNGRVKQVELVNEGRDTIDTKLGTLETVIVRTRNVESSSRETLTWLAPSLNNLPVRIEQLKNNDLVARLSIRHYSEAN